MRLSVYASCHLVSILLLGSVKESGCISKCNPTDEHKFSPVRQSSPPVQLISPVQ